MLRVSTLNGEPAAARRPTLPALSIERLWQVVALVAPIIMTAGAAAFTIDTWWDLTMGRLMVEARRPLVDAVLSFAPAAPGSVHGQWLAHVLLYAAYALTGEAGLRLFAGGIVALAFGLVMLAGQARGGSARTSALGAVLALFVAVNNLALRAQLFSYLLFALVCLLLTLRQRHPRGLYALPAVFALWANLHGAFLMGLVLVGLHAGDAVLDAIIASWNGQLTRWRDPARLLAILAASVLAAMLTPLGPSVYTYVWSIASYASSKTLIPEWQPTTIQDFGGQALVASGLLMALILKASRRPVRRVDVLTLLAYGLVALTSQRQVVWWGMIAGPMLAGYAAALPRPAWLPRTQPPPPSPRPREGEGTGAGASAPNWLLAGLLVLLGLGSPLWRPALADRLEGGASSALSTPTGIADVAATLPEGARLFVFQPWTGYFAWRLWPRQQSLVDARFETHPTWVWDEYQAVSTGRADWEQIVDRYQIAYLVLEAQQQGFLADLALQTGRWSPVYRDEIGMILARVEATHP